MRVDVHLHHQRKVNLSIIKASINKDTFGCPHYKERDRDEDHIHYVELSGSPLHH
jgi:hypothetical protein